MREIVKRTQLPINQMPGQSPGAKQREMIIDLFRGFTVVLMIITHVIGLTYDYQKGTDIIVYYIGQIGGIASFTAFLLLSGISAYLSYIKYNEKEEVAQRTPRVFLRSLKVVVIFFVLSIVGVFILGQMYLTKPSLSWAGRMFDAVTLKNLVEYTEFLPALAIFSFSLIFFRKIYKSIASSIWLTLLLGSITYFVGTLLVSFNLPSERMNTFKSLFVGHLFNGEGIHSFPIFQYLIIFLLGIYIGRYFLEYNSANFRLALIAKFMIGFVLIAVGSTLIYNYTNIILFYPLPIEGRFPPSIGFIALSLSIALFVLTTFYLTFRIIPKGLIRFVNYIGQNAFTFFYFHILILFGFKYYFDNNQTFTKPTDLLGIIIMTFVTLFLCLIGSRLLEHFGTVVQGKEFQADFRHFIVNVLPNFVILISFVFFIIIVYTNLRLTSEASQVESRKLNKTLVLGATTDTWWNDSYKTKRIITIKNNSGVDYYAGDWVKISLNHRDELNKKNALNLSGVDFRIIFIDNGTFEEIPFILDSPGTENTSLSFQIQKNIPNSQSNSNYFIYFGNSFETKYPQSTIKPDRGIIDKDITQSGNIFHPISGKVNRTWFLKNSLGTKLLDNLIFEINLNDVTISTNSLVTYKIEGTNIGGEMNKVNGNTYSISSNISSLKNGQYSIQAKIVDIDNNLKIISTYSVPFYISFPLYVTWTLDWDGWGVAQYDLNTMSSISSKYGMPIVQLFNPRIYLPLEKQTGSVPKVSPESAEYLTKWVLNRQKNNGDEIGMHIHMFADMVKEAGVEPRSVFASGAMYGDSLTNAYSQIELETVFDWGLTQFEEHELPFPISYRSGGWSSGPQVLKAAQNVGFLIDTTGRTGGPINPSIPSSTKLPWSLTTRTRPYQPSVNDINKWEGSRLKIWEFPNNGADSYWFSKEQLIQRFQDNYQSNGIMTYPQVLTYLTHPHWVTSRDAPKLRALFDYINQFKYSNDSGPVVYSTLEKIFKEWDKKLNNGN